MIYFILFLFAYSYIIYLTLKPKKMQLHSLEYVENLVKQKTSIPFTIKTFSQRNFTCNDREVIYGYHPTTAFWHFHQTTDTNMPSTGYLIQFHYPIDASFIADCVYSV